MNGDINGESLDVRDNDPAHYVPSPRHNPRLRPEGESYALRNRQGCGERWYDYSEADAEEIENRNPHHADRMPSDEARKNAEVNKGTIRDIFGGYCDTPRKRANQPRAVTTESRDIAQANKGDNMKHLIDDYGRCTPDPPPIAKVKGDLASEYAERNKGCVNNIINNYGVREPSDADVERERMNQRNHINRMPKGDTMDGIIKMEAVSSRPESKGYGRCHEVSKECSWDELPPHRHSRPEGEQISRQMTNSMADIMSMKGEAAKVEQPKVLPPQNQTQETPTPRPSTATRVRPEGQSNYDRDHSSLTMNAIFGIGSDETTSRPVRLNRMMQRSEQW